MDDRHSGGRTAAQAVRAAKAAANIARAAAVSGLPGAAAATAKETLPFLVKLSLGIIITIFVLLMMVISAIPNIFFGFGGTKTAEIATMNNQAKALGSTYINLEDARSTQVDAIVTAIVSEYESRGITINKIKVANRLSRDDIIWIIATNSVANEQNLSVMTPDKIISFCSSHLSYTSSLFSEDEVITLVIRFMGVKELIFGGVGNIGVHSNTFQGSIQEWLPIHAITGGVVITKDGRFIKIMEILPVNIYLKSPADRQAIIESFAAYLKIAPDTLQIQARTLPTDTSDYIQRMEQYAENESNIFCREMIEDNIREIGQGMETAKKLGHPYIILAALTGQVQSGIFDGFRIPGQDNVLALREDVVLELVGHDGMGFPGDQPFWSKKGDALHAPVIQTHRKT